MTGKEPDQSPPDTESAPEDAFALVGHEIRAEIIQVLSPGIDLSLSEVRARLDADVQPSQLHYHLEQLVGHFVRKTDEGYILNGVGNRLRWTLSAGSLNRQGEQMAVAANFNCYDCQTPAEAIFIFDNSRVRLVCPDCEYQYMVDYYDMPLDVFEDEAAAFAHFRRYMVLRNFFWAQSICPNCANPLSPTLLEHPESTVLDHQERLKVIINQPCDRCGAGWWQSVGMGLLTDPGLRSFCAEHGVDVLSTPHWEFEFAITDNHLTIRSTDPWEVALAVTFDGDTLELVIDGDLNVIERNRLDAAGGDELSLPDKEACLEHLRDHRWPDEVTCPHCDSVDTIKKGKSKTDVQRYRCHACDTIFNDLTGTIFAEHKLSLPEMLHIIREMEETKTAQIVRQLDRSYPSVLDFMDEVRDARDGDPELELGVLAEGDEITAPADENRTE